MCGRRHRHHVRHPRARRPACADVDGEPQAAGRRSPASCRRRSTDDHEFDGRGQPGQLPDDASRSPAPATARSSCSTRRQRRSAARTTPASSATTETIVVDAARRPARGRRASATSPPAAPTTATVDLRRRRRHVRHQGRRRHVVELDRGADRLGVHERAAPPRADGRDTDARRRRRRHHARHPPSRRRRPTSRPASSCPATVAAGRASNADACRCSTTAAPPSRPPPSTVHRDAPDGPVVPGHGHHSRPTAAASPSTSRPTARARWRSTSWSTTGDTVAEASEANNTQTVGAAGVARRPARAHRRRRRRARRRGHRTPARCASLGIPYAVVTEHADAADHEQLRGRHLGSRPRAVPGPDGRRRPRRGRGVPRRRRQAAVHATPRRRRPRRAAGRHQPAGHSRHRRSSPSTSARSTSTPSRSAAAWSPARRHPRRRHVPDRRVPRPPAAGRLQAAEASKGAVTPVATWEQGGDESLMGVRVAGDDGFRSVFLGFNPSQLVTGDDVATVLHGRSGGSASTGAVNRPPARSSATRPCAMSSPTPTSPSRRSWSGHRGLRRCRTTQRWRYIRRGSNDAQGNPASGRPRSLPTSLT